MFNPDWEIHKYDKVADLKDGLRIVYVYCSDCAWELRVPVLFDHVREYYTKEGDLKARITADELMLRHIKNKHEKTEV